MKNDNDNDEIPFKTIAGNKFIKAQATPAFYKSLKTLKQLFYVLLFASLPIIAIGFGQFMTCKYNHPKWTSAQCWKSMFVHFGDAKKD